MKKKALSLALAFCLLLGMVTVFTPVIASAADSTYEFNPGTAWRLIWRDEFDGVNHNGGAYNPTAGGVDKSNWGFQSGGGATYGNAGWGNGESENFIPEMATVADGLLRMHAQPRAGSGYTDLNADGGTWHSVKLISSPRTTNYRGGDLTSTRSNSNPATGYAGTYGRIEARIKLPGNQGTWPAFWMIPQDNVYGGWAASGEIDIMEQTGGHLTDIAGTIHCGGPWPGNWYRSQTYNFPAGDTVQDFHVYAVEWEATQIRWYVDGACYGTRNANEWSTTGAPNNPLAPFDQDFYLLLQLSIGGTLAGGMANPGTPVDMYVDYVRVYEQIGDDVPTPFTLTASAATACPGDMVTIDVSAENNPGVKGFTLNLAYDDAKLDFVSMDTAALASLGLAMPGGSTAGNVSLTFVASGSNLLSDDGKLYSITFKVKDTAPDGEIPLTLSGLLGDPSGQSLEAVFVNGAAHVLSYKLGDVNGDGDVNVLDAILLQSIWLGDLTPTPAQFLAADVNRDGAVDANDLVLLMQYITGGYGIVLE